MNTYEVRGRNVADTIPIEYIIGYITAGELPAAHRAARKIFNGQDTAETPNEITEIVVLTDAQIEKILLDKVL